VAAFCHPAAIDARSRLVKLRQACRQIVGIPDYERYVEHCALHHPGEKPLSRAEFVARAIDRKYGKSGPRCC
jgi:uncharacterized short protein YbdD (DUF466 family)